MHERRFVPVTIGQLVPEGRGQRCIFSSVLANLEAGAMINDTKSSSFHHWLPSEPSTTCRSNHVLSSTKLGRWSNMTLQTRSQAAPPLPAQGKLEPRA